MVALVLVGLGLVACTSTGPAPVYSREDYGPAPPGFYRVRDGDSLSAIAFRRKLDYRTLAQWNHLSPPYRIYAGKLLRVEPPGGKTGGSGSPARTVQKGDKQTRKKDVDKIAKAPTSPSRATSGAKTEAGSGLNWAWPLKGKVVQTFRQRDRTRQGIRIAGRAGQQVAAAEGGTVVYSGSGLKGYGNLIIVKHNNNYLSAYGFNRRLLVTEGQRVKRGQDVAEVGQASGGEYLLHFEIRKSGTAVNPLRYLPKTP